MTLLSWPLSYRQNPGLRAIGRLVFGARDLRFGGVRSKFRIADSELLNHRVEIVEGVLAVECVELLQRFFARKRQARKPVT